MEKKKQKTNEVLHVTSVGIGSNKRLRVTWDNNVSIRLFSTTRENPLEIRLLVKCDSIDLLSNVTACECKGGIGYTKTDTDKIQVYCEGPAAKLRKLR